MSSIKRPTLWIELVLVRISLVDTIMVQVVVIWQEVIDASAGFFIFSSSWRWWYWIEHLRVNVCLDQVLYFWNHKWITINKINYKTTLLLLDSSTLNVNVSYFLTRIKGFFLVCCCCYLFTLLQIFWI